MDTALLLNASFEPHDLISAQRAVVLVFCDKADLIEIGEGEFRSPTLTVPKPSVLRLRTYVRTNRNQVGFSRRGLRLRDEGKCQYCGKPGDSVDHVVPRSKNGPTSWNNTVLACFTCNQKKADKSLAECGMTLARHPEPPSTSTRFALVAPTPPSWQPYLSMNR